MQIGDQTTARMAAIRERLAPNGPGLDTADARYLVERVTRLEEGLAALLEPEDDRCDYDHHGNCQAHGIQNPCEVAVALAALRDEPPPTERPAED